MLKITIELIPFGNEYEPAQKIGTLWIGNDGTGDVETGNYKFRFLTKGKGTKIGKLKGFKRERGCWQLILEILKSVSSKI